jgi:hypothetical protein
MLAKPGNRFRAVTRLIAERIEIAFRSPAAANILNRDVVAVSRKPDRMRVDHGRRNVPPVGLTHKQRGPWPGPSRIVVIGGERNAIAQPATQATLQSDAVATIDQSHD